MGYTLRRHDRTIEIDTFDWYGVLGYASEHQWIPGGTLAPLDFNEDEHGEWHGHYEVSAFQIVTARDAANLAKALEGCSYPRIETLLKFLREGGFEIG